MSDKLWALKSSNQKRSFSVELGIILIIMIQLLMYVDLKEGWVTIEVIWLSVLTMLLFIWFIILVSYAFAIHWDGLNRHIWEYINGEDYSYHDVEVDYADE